MWPRSHKRGLKSLGMARATGKEEWGTITMSSTGLSYFNWPRRVGLLWQKLDWNITLSCIVCGFELYQYLKNDQNRPQDPFADVSFGGLYVPCIINRMLGGIIVGDSGLCCCVPVHVWRQLFERNYFPFVDIPRPIVCWFFKTTFVKTGRR